MNFKQWLINESAKTIKAYHGSDKSFSKFNLKKSTQGIIWFTSNKENIINKEVGASGHGYIYELEININNPAGWEEYDKYVLDQLQSMGYDSVILPEQDGFSGFVFDPSKIKIIKKEKI